MKLTNYVKKEKQRKKNQSQDEIKRNSYFEYQNKKSKELEEKKNSEAINAKKAFEKHQYFIDESLRKSNENLNRVFSEIIKQDMTNERSQKLLRKSQRKLDIENLKNNFQKEKTNKRNEMKDFKERTKKIAEINLKSKFNSSMIVILFIIKQQCKKH